MQETTVSQHGAIEAMAPPRRHSPVIYALLNEQKQVFYVGLSTALDRRFAYHRAAYGKLIKVMILQDEFVDEKPRAAEKKWITHYERVFGIELLNVVHSAKRKPGKMKPEPEPGDSFITIHIPQISAKKWALVRAEVQRRGLYMRGAVNQMIDAWLEKQRIDQKARSA
jgi:predicted GIY-YIG superfamily endonuclease